MCRTRNRRHKRIVTPAVRLRQSETGRLNFRAWYRQGSLHFRQRPSRLSLPFAPSYFRTQWTQVCVPGRQTICNPRCFLDSGSDRWCGKVTVRSCSDSLEHGLANCGPRNSSRIPGGNFHDRKIFPRSRQRTVCSFTQTQLISHSHVFRTGHWETSECIAGNGESELLLADQLDTIHTETTNQRNDTFAWTTDVTEVSYSDWGSS